MQKHENKHYETTDLGNAERFISEHKEYLKSTGSSKTWLRWNGHKWVRANDSVVYELAINTVNTLLTDALNNKGPHSEHARRWALASQSDARLRALVNLAAKHPDLMANLSEFDRSPFILNCRNGTVDLRYKEFTPAHSSDLLTKSVNCEYNPHSKCPEFEAFVSSIFNYDEELISWAQRAIGYLFFGLTDEQKCFFAYGTGANGKSTLFEVIKYVMGDYAATADVETFMKGNKSDVRVMEAVGELKGIRFALASEIDSSYRISEALLKRLTGGDTLRGTYLRQSAFEFVPQFKLCFLTNHLPFARDGSHGFWRRIEVIPFLRQYNKKEIRSDLLEVLKQEAEGILLWCMNGAASWYKKRHEEGGGSGLGNCSAIDEATASYRFENDLFSRFIEETCAYVEGYNTSARELYRQYQMWSEANGDRYPISEVIFSRRMEERGHKKKRRSGGILYENLKCIEPIHNF